MSDITKRLRITSMFYNVPYEQLSKVKMSAIKTHSFLEKESRLLKYVHNRNIVDVDKAEMDFSVYEMDVLENQIRIPKLKELYERKRASLRAFQNGKDLWKSDRNGL